MYSNRCPSLVGHNGRKKITKCTKSLKAELWLLHTGFFFFCANKKSEKSADWQMHHPITWVVRKGRCISHNNGNNNGCHCLCLSVLSVFWHTKHKSLKQSSPGKVLSISWASSEKTDKALATVQEPWIVPPMGGTVSSLLWGGETSALHLYFVRGDVP